MSFTQQIQPSLPPDEGEAPSLGAQRMRNFKAAIMERLTGWVYAFDTAMTEVLTGLKYAPFRKQSAKPTAEAETLQVYAKLVGASLELFCQTPAGVEIQITENGMPYQKDANGSPLISQAGYDANIAGDLADLSAQVTSEVTAMVGTIATGGSSGGPTQKKTVLFGYAYTTFGSSLAQDVGYCEIEVQVSATANFSSYSTLTKMTFKNNFPTYRTHASPFNVIIESGYYWRVERTASYGSQSWGTVTRTMEFGV